LIKLSPSAIEDIAAELFSHTSLSISGYAITINGKCINNESEVQICMFYDHLGLSKVIHVYNLLDPSSLPNAIQTFYNLVCDKSKAFVAKSDRNNYYARHGAGTSMLASAVVYNSPGGLIDKMKEDYKNHNLEATHFVHEIDPQKLVDKIHALNEELEITHV